MLKVIQRLEGDETYLRQNWSLPPEAARMLSLLVRMKNAQRILEIGTSVGYSGLYLGLALLESDGHLDSIDADPTRQEQARQHFEEAGLSDRITLHRGDALETLARLQAEGRTYDLMFLDARKSEYVDYLHKAERLVEPGGILLADNTRSHRQEVQPFLSEVLASESWDACDIDTPNGFILALKR